MSRRLFVKNTVRTKSNRRSVGAKSARSGAKLAKLRGQSSSLKSAKMAAARSIANAVTAGFLGIEKKFLDCSKSLTAITAASTLAGGEYDPSSGCSGCLSCPAQGDSEQQRDGKRIVIDSLILKGFVHNPGSASAAFEAESKVFIAVVLDTQSNGAQLDSEAVFKSLGATDVLNVCPTKNLLSGNRFRILKSQVFDLTPIGVASAGNLAFNATRRDFDWYIPFKGGLQVNLNAGTTAEIANVIDNSLHVIAFATLAGCNIAYNSRVRFQG